MHEPEYDRRSWAGSGHPLVWDRRRTIVGIVLAELLALGDWCLLQRSDRPGGPGIHRVRCGTGSRVDHGAVRPLLYAAAAAAGALVVFPEWRFFFDYEPAPLLLWGIVGLTYALFALWLIPRFRSSPYVMWPLIALAFSLPLVHPSWVLGWQMEWAVYGQRVVLGAVWLVSLGIRPRPYATWAVLAILVTLLGLAEFGSRPNELATGTLLRLGAQEGHRVAAGEYWRLFTSIFLHLGYLHLIGNGASILVLGHLVERWHGAKRFLTIFLIAGLAGSVAGYIYGTYGWSTVSGGASGAAYGLAGALLVFALLEPGRLSALGPLSRGIVMIMLGFLAASTALGLWDVITDSFRHHTLVAHTGGFVSGLLLALALIPRNRPAQALQQRGEGRVSHVADTVRRWWVLPVAAIVLALGVIAGNERTPQVHVQNATEHRVRGNLTLAQDEVWKAFDKDPLYGSAFLEQAWILMEMGDLEAAQQEARTALHYELSASERDEASRLLGEIQRR